MASVPQKERDDIASSISKLAIDSGKTAAGSKSKKFKEPVLDSWEDEDVSDESAAEAEDEGDDDDDNDGDDDDDDDDDNDRGAQEAEVETSPPSSTPSSLATPAVPPPTPASPLGYDSPHEWASLASQSQSQSQSPVATSASGSGSGTPARRPEKTDAVARRMIAAGLGLKAPKQTDEQRAYQRSIREQEKKRRDQERAEEERQRELADKAKAAVWDD
ncbi:hypothetical protein Trco_003932 [Trichoderma cornu-damae]|uniref:Ubiquitin-like protein smt3 n=1 Tax=Trichoderma cornu-damae TaxID=654480 RepID=A0A9P8QM09_9HYPO|nr:hypothetical protein Trco_003932 [Trichoderma cornu-damae]